MSLGLNDGCTEVLGDSELEGTVLGEDEVLGDLLGRTSVDGFVDGDAVGLSVRADTLPSRYARADLVTQEMSNGGRNGADLVNPVRAILKRHIDIRMDPMQV